MRACLDDPAKNCRSPIQLPRPRTAKACFPRSHQYRTPSVARLCMLHAAIMSLSRDNSLRRIYALRRWQGFGLVEKG